jgi:hypothetical protein
MSEENYIKAELELVDGARIVGLTHVSREMHSAEDDYFECECCGEPTVDIDYGEDDDGALGFVVEFSKVHLEIAGEEDDLLFGEPVALCEMCQNDALELVGE